jgi:hypothetical protein
VVQLLLDRGADQTLLAKLAAKEGQVAVIQLLQTRLVTAAANGQISKIRQLLKCGVDINAITPNGTALSEAARAGHELSVGLLLRKAADVHAAAIILQGFDYAQLTVTRLFENASRVRKIECARSYRYILEKVPNLRYLHKSFVAQHMLMIKAAQRSPTQFLELSQRFWGYREAWSAGIRTLRGLCSGESPRDVGDTIAFLCLAKAISETLQRTGTCDESKQFFRDLDRWQLLSSQRQTVIPTEMQYTLCGELCLMKIFQARAKLMLLSYYIFKD